MVETAKPVEGTVACEVCGKVVPASEARIARVRSYEASFCSIECMVEWEEQEARGDEGASGA